MSWRVGEPTGWVLFLLVHANTGNNNCKSRPLMVAGSPNGQHDIMRIIRRRWQMVRLKGARPGAPFG